MDPGIQRGREGEGPFVSTMLRPCPAYIAGHGQRLAFEVAGSIGSLSSCMEGDRRSSRLTWERSGFFPKEIDVAQIYDDFSASVIRAPDPKGRFLPARLSSALPIEAPRHGTRYDLTFTVVYIEHEPQHSTQLD
jgi:hypothetical protein